MDTRFLRNKHLIPQKKLTEITIIGLGGIGSELVQILSIMGFNRIIGYDHDKLEIHNLSSTKYPECYVGQPKAVAAQKIVYMFNAETECEFNEQKFTGDQYLSPMVIICTDNMDSRLSAYQAWNRMLDKQYFIDIRMGALVLEIITTTFFYDNYMKYWKKDSDISEEPCTMRHTIFTASVSAGLGVSQLFRLIKRVPFYDWIWEDLMFSRKQTGILVKDIPKES